MITCNSRHLLILAILASGLAGILVLSSCSSESPTIPPTFRVGTLEGRVLAMGEPVSCDIRIDIVRGNRITYGHFRTGTDSSGWYQIDLPTGLYRISYTENTSNFRYEVRDTVQIHPGRYRQDLDLIRVEMLIGIPEELQGDHSRIELVNDAGHAGAPGDSVAPGWMQFVLPAVGPGDYRMKLAYPDGPTVYLPGTHDRDEGEILTLPSDQVTTYELDLRGSFATISGRVQTGCEGNSYSEPGVTAMVADEQKVVRAPCDDDGYFRMNFFVLEPVRLAVNSGYNVQWIGGDSFATARVFDLQPGSRFTDVDLTSCGFQMTLTGPGHLINHDPEFKLLNEAGDEIEISRSWHNPIVVCNLPPGRYYLYADGRCNNEVWMPQWYGGSSDRDEAMPIELSYGEFKELEMVLEEGGRIRGNLLNPDGTRPWAVTVNLADSTGATFCSSMPWFPGGRFELKGLADGEYHMFTIWQNSAWIYPGTYKIEEALTITVTDRQVVDGVSWELPGIIDPEGP